LDSGFHIVPKGKWILREKIGEARMRKLLNSGGYEKLINEMALNAKVILHKRERSKGYPLYYRIVVHLEMNSKLVDSFHNSNFGYRAQYFSSKKNGENANRYALTILTPVILAQLRKKHKYTCPLDWVEKSLNGKFAKIWIHQGRWLLHKKKSDRNLLVKRWQSSGSDNLNKNNKKRVVWGSLTPESEKIVDIKGSFITLAGTNLGNDLKPLRSHCLNELGFT
jgi:hypothetical protein